VHDTPRPLAVGSLWDTCTDRGKFVRKRASCAKESTRERKVLSERERVCVCVHVSACVCTCLRESERDSAGEREQADEHSWISAPTDGSFSSNVQHSVGREVERSCHPHTSRYMDGGASFIGCHCSEHMGVVSHIVRHPMEVSDGANPAAGAGDAAADVGVAAAVAAAC
jgi:hypothetical protein